MKANPIIKQQPPQEGGLQGTELRLGVAFRFMWASAIQIGSWATVLILNT